MKAVESLLVKMARKHANQVGLDVSDQVVEIGRDLEEFSLKDFFNGKPSNMLELHIHVWLRDSEDHPKHFCAIFQRVLVDAGLVLTCIRRDTNPQGARNMGYHSNMSMLVDIGEFPESREVPLLAVVKLQRFDQCRVLDPAQPSAINMVCKTFYTITDGELEPPSGFLIKRHDGGVVTRPSVDNVVKRRSDVVHNVTKYNSKLGWRRSWGLEDVDMLSAIRPYFSDNYVSYIIEEPLASVIQFYQVVLCAPKFEFGASNGRESGHCAAS